jgi:superfamily I DNA/RNA helicase
MRALAIEMSVGTFHQFGLELIARYPDRVGRTEKVRTSAGVAALGAKAVARIVKTIAVYDDFCHANDPYEEHDFGSFEVDGQTIFFKIDYYDKALAYHSPDPTDPSITERVITIMLAEEY